jgi:NADH-quinone oxidoreductase subunit H
MNELVNSHAWQQLFVLPTGQIEWWAEVVRAVLRLAIGVLGALLQVPVLVWLERRLLGFLQGRLGPNRVGPFGLLQPLADALKLMFKEDIIPTNVDRTLFVIAPIVALAPVVMSVGVLPWNGSREWGAIAPGLNIGILFLLAVASIEVYGVILAGWSSNNKYSLLGGLRASSQVISYELGMGLAILCVLLMTGSLGTQDIVMGRPAADGLFLNGQGVVREVPIAGTGYTVYEHGYWSGFWDWNFLRLFPFGTVAAFIYLVSMIAETNRAPFDLPEAETELVAGFHTEYSSFKFAMFFMGEYANMLIVSAIAVTLFFGGWLAPFGFASQIPADASMVIPPWLINLLNNCVIAPFWFVSKLYILIGAFILVRATFPRLRYDMLMKFGWKGLLPTALVNLFLIALCIALQQFFREKGYDETLATFLGWILAIAAGAVLLGILFLFKRADYEAKRRAARTTDLSAPIRRPTVVTPTPAGAPSPEV